MSYRRRFQLSKTLPRYSSRSRQQPLLDGKAPRDIAPVVAPTLLSKNATPASMQRLVDSMTALHKDSYLKAIAAMTRYEPVAKLAEIKVPTLVICGDEDKLTPPAVSQDMANTIPGARLAILEAAGHLSNIEQPAAFNTVLREFLTALPR